MTNRVAPFVVLAFVASYQCAYGGSIFDRTPFAGAAKWVGDRTGTGNLQEKLGLPNAGGTVGNFLEKAKKDAAPLVTTITTLACPGCLLVAGAVSGPGAVLDALFTTGVVSSAFSLGAGVGLVTVVIMGADNDSGQVGYQEVTVPSQPATPTNVEYTVSAACIATVENMHRSYLLFTDVPADASKYKPGDTFRATAPNCGSVVDSGSKVNESITIRMTGANPVSMTKPRYQYIVLGEPI